MMQERNARLFRHGRRQAVRIPADFELPGQDVVVRKRGDGLLIQPRRKRKSLLSLLAGLEALEEDFPEIDDLPPDPVEI